PCAYPRWLESEREDRPALPPPTSQSTLDPRSAIPDPLSSITVSDSITVLDPRYFEYNSTTRLSLMSWPNSERSGAPLKVPANFFTSTSTHDGKPILSASCNASTMRSCVLAPSLTATTSPALPSADGMSTTLPLTVTAPAA